MAITTLFLDIGGVLLTNGWGRGSRKAAALHFNIDPVEMDERHHLTFDTYEMGKLTIMSTWSEPSFMKKEGFLQMNSSLLCMRNPRNCQVQSVILNR